MSDAHVIRMDMTRSEGSSLVKTLFDVLLSVSIMVSVYYYQCVSLSVCITISVYYGQCIILIYMYMTYMPTFTCVLMTHCHYSMS